MKTMRQFNRSGIIARSLMITLAAFLVVAAGSIALTSYKASQRVRTTIQVRLTQLFDTVENTIKIACFVNDQELAKEVAQGLLNNSEVLQVTIVAGDETLTDQQHPDAVVESADMNDLDQIRDIESPFSRGEIIGKVVLRHDPRFVEELRWESVKGAMEQTLLQLGFVAIVIIASLVFFIVRPITQLTGRLNEMRPEEGQRLEVPDGHEKTELGQLVGKVNELSDSLVSSIDDLKVAREAAEAASSAKASFLANMSHEIRTPIYAVLGLARIGFRDGKDAETTKHFQRILAAGNHLLGIINDVLDYSKIEAGKFDVAKQGFKLDALMEAVENLTQPLIKDKPVTFELRCDTALREQWYLGDSQRIQQILVNLLSNAVKFTSEGCVSLEVASPRSGELQFSVVDTGLGISAEQLARLFKPFEQADSSMTRRFGGTGLGLAISQRLASLMGGEIRVVSAEGQGSRFTLQLPLVASGDPHSPATASADVGQTYRALAGLRLLAAEDIDINRYILGDLIAEFGGEVEFAENGLQAVAMVREKPSGYDLILMDVQMPEMDGLEATRIIREVAPGVPVIGLTAHAMEEERQRCLAAGMCARVTKPIEPHELVECILRWTAKNGQNPKGTDALIG